MESLERTVTELARRVERWLIATRTTRLLGRVDALDPIRT